MNTASHYYPQLTGVRALAAYFIFLHHNSTKMFGETVYAMERELHIGVPIFFVLSGLLIYLRYSESCRLEKGWLLSYFKNRFARIYPIYFLIILLQYCMMNGGLFDFFMQATFIRGFSAEYKFIGVSQGWSLTAEETFYFLFPLLLLVIKRVGFLIPLLAVYGVGSLLLKGGTWADWHSFFMPEQFMSYYTFFGQASQFFAGMFLAKWLLTPEMGTLIKEKFSKNLTWAGFGGIAFCVLCFLLLHLRKGGGLGLFTPAGLLINHTLLPCSVAVLFYGLLTEESWIRDVLQSKLVVILGRSSYIFYLIQAGFFRKFILTHVSRNIIILFILLNVLSVFFYFVIERPCQKFIKNFRWKSNKRLPVTS